MSPMRSRPLVASLLLVGALSACTPSSGLSPTMISETLTLGACPGEGASEIVCVVAEHIDADYVDPVDHARLATAALTGLDGLEPVPTQSPSVCAVPWPELAAVCREIDRRHLDPTAALESAMAAMVHAGLDPYSAYIDPASLALLDEQQSGTVEGIGALVTTEDETAADPSTALCPIVSETCRLVVVSVLPDSPAESAGLRSGDAIVAVDGEPATGQALEVVTAKVRGPAGTSVSIGVLREKTVLDIEVERAAIEVPTVDSALVADTAYLRLTSFTATAADRVHSALGDLVAAHPSLFILDLRDNPGGSLEGAVDIAGEFLDGGPVVRTLSPDAEKTYEDEPGGLALDVPTVVLVNRGSASASEVVAGALADRNRALIVGTRTFGKNTVQQRFPLPNGGALKLTVARWATPGGHDFGGVGIIPDVTADIPPDLPPEDIVALVSSLVSPAPDPRNP